MGNLNPPTVNRYQSPGGHNWQIKYGRPSKTDENAKKSLQQLFQLKNCPFNLI